MNHVLDIIGYIALEMGGKITQRWLVLLLARLLTCEKRGFPKIWVPQTIGFPIENKQC